GARAGVRLPPDPAEGEEEGGAAEPAGAGARERIVVEVGGKRLDVVLPAGLGVAAGSGAAGGAGKNAARPRPGRAKRAAGAGGDALTSPMQGTIVKIVAGEGQRGSAGGTAGVPGATTMAPPL